MDLFGIPRRAACATLSVAATLLTGASAQAAQFVATDVTYTHSAQTTSDSHYRVNPSAETPANWTSPVDYATGSAHVRLEVFTKPNTTTQTCFQVCFEAAQNYGCTDISRPYTTTGVYEWDTPFSRFYTPGPVSWNTGVRKVAVLLKDTMNGKPAPPNVSEATSALYMPTDVHVTVTIVSAGSTYQPPAGGSTGSADSGTPPTPRGDAATSQEAATRPARDASIVDARVAIEAAAPEAASTATPTERPPSPEAATPVPSATATVPPTTGGQAGAGGSGPASVPSGNPPATPSDPAEDGGGCSVVRLSPTQTSPLKMLASVVVLAFVASRRRRVTAPRAKRKACL